MLPLPGDTMAMDDEGEGSQCSSRLDAPFHLAPPLPDCHVSNPPEAVNDEDAPSLTAVMRRHKEEPDEGDQLVLAAFKETMQPVDTVEHLHHESEQVVYSATNQARMMLLPTSEDGDNAGIAKEDQPNLQLCTALRVRNAMVALLTGNQSIEQSERAELALYIRSTLSMK
eukprot:TRINITY_DN17659_c0_g1_i2.p1 TRINITY_DN17659_c0_g1~~TRINITY_DN17659_c0_g1_i2.p1  ORF type:complete len:170 (+),score=10.41 TRINITY_DN17659_c0_g1_i2:512-1021(+)